MSPRKPAPEPSPPARRRTVAAADPPPRGRAAAARPAPASRPAGRAAPPAAPAAPPVRGRPRTRAASEAQQDEASEGEVDVLYEAPRPQVPQPPLPVAPEPGRQAALAIPFQATAVARGSMGIVRQHNQIEEWALSSPEPPFIQALARLYPHPLVRVQYQHPAARDAQAVGWLFLPGGVPSVVVAGLFDALLGRVAVESLPGTYHLVIQHAEYLASLVGSPAAAAR